MKRILQPSLLACLLALAACASATTPAARPAQGASAYDTLVTRATQEMRRAADQGFLWLHTERYLADSRRAYATGDIEKAMRLAQAALDQALLAQKQAADSAEVKADFAFRQ